MNKNKLSRPMSVNADFSPSKNRKIPRHKIKIVGSYPRQRNESTEPDRPKVLETTASRFETGIETQESRVETHDDLVPK